MPEVTQGATETVATPTTPAPSAVLEAKFADREAMRGKSKAERAALARAPTKVEAVAPAAPEKPPEPKVEEKKEEPKEDTEPGKKPVEEAPVEEEKAGKGFAALAKQEAKFQAERKAWEQQRRAAETADAEKGKDTSTKIAAFESASKRARHDLPGLLASLGITDRVDMVKAADQLYYHLVDDKAAPEVQAKKLQVTLAARLAEQDEKVEQAKKAAEATIADFQKQQQSTAIRAAIAKELPNIPESCEIVKALIEDRSDYVVQQIHEMGDKWIAEHPGEAKSPGDVVKHVALAWQADLEAQLAPVIKMLAKKQATSADQKKPAPPTLSAASTITRQPAAATSRAEQIEQTKADMRRGQLR